MATSIDKHAKALNGIWAGYSDDVKYVDLDDLLAEKMANEDFKVEDLELEFPHEIDKEPE